MLSFVPNGTDWTLDPVFDEPDRTASSVNTPVVTLAVAETAFAHWPPLEALVQDGRYSYAGAAGARGGRPRRVQRPARQSVEWVTEDHGGAPRAVAGHRDASRRR